MIVPPPIPTSSPEAEIIHALAVGTISSYVVSFAGNSQYSAGGGMSSCGLAALNCARIILGKEQGGPLGASLLSDILKRQTLEVCLVLFPREPRADPLKGDPPDLPYLDEFESLGSRGHLSDTDISQVT